MHKKLILLFMVLSYSLCLSGEESVLSQFSVPTIGKFKNCNISLDCNSTKECAQQSRCEKSNRCEKEYRSIKKRCSVRGDIGKLFGGKLVDPACVANLESQKSSCERSVDIEYDTCRNRQYKEKIQCEITRKQTVSQCHQKQSIEQEYCESIKSTQIESSVATLKEFEAILSSSSSKRKLDIPDKVKESFVAVFDIEILETIKIVQTSDFSVWYSFIYSEKEFADWNKVLKVPGANSRDLRVAGNNIYLSPTMEIKDIPIPWFISAVIQVELFEKLGVDGYSQIYTNDFESITSYISSSTAMACESIECYPE